MPELSQEVPNIDTNKSKKIPQGYIDFMNSQYQYEKDCIIDNTYLEKIKLNSDVLSYKNQTIPKINSKELYETYLKDIATNLEDIFSLPNWIISSVAEQESMYWLITKSEWWSKWIMQLNSAPFHDMIKSPGKYSELFSNIPDYIVDLITPIEARNVLWNIIAELKKEQLDTKNLSTLFKQLHKYARWDYPNSDLLNLVCWSIYLAFCYNSKIFNKDKSWNINWLKRIHLSKISSLWEKSAWKDLINHKWYKLDESDKEAINTIVRSIKADLADKWNNSKQTKKEFLLAREYNGSKEKNEYAFNVLVAKRFNEAKYKTSETN